MCIGVHVVWEKGDLLFRISTAYNCAGESLALK